MKYPLASLSWDDKEISAGMEVLKSGYYTMGPLVSEFEECFSSFIGSKYAVFCNSGSSANLLAIAACLYNPEIDLNIGDEVLVPAVSWSTTYAPLYQMGLKVKFIDVNLSTFNIDVKSISDNISPQTKAIFAVNLLGNCCEYDILEDICNKNKLILLEDNCESLGAELNGKNAGNFGLIGTHSTFFSHHIATMEGGVCVTDDELTYEILKSARAHGWTRNVTNPDLFYKYFPKPKSTLEEKFHFVMPGFNLRPTEMQAALGISQMKKLPLFIKSRRENALYFQKTPPRYKFNHRFTQMAYNNE